MFCVFVSLFFFLFFLFLFLFLFFVFVLFVCLVFFLFFFFFVFFGGGAFWKENKGINYVGPKCINNMYYFLDEIYVICREKSRYHGSPCS